MQVTFWGTRGSIAKAGPSTLRYGGNTSCVELCSGAGTLVVIDCGTGAHGLGQDIATRGDGAPIVGHMLISHTHWDHIQGLPFFAPLFRPDNTWHIYGPRGLGSSLSDTLSGQMQYSYFPVSIEQLAAAVDYHDLVEGTFDIEEIRVDAHYLNHPALTLGYRLEVDGATVVYASDHEPHHRALAAGGDMDISRHDRAHAQFFEGADLLIHDAQYLADEYAGKVGWGHSTVEYVIDAARYAGVGQVALYHHDPTRSDDAVDAVVGLARAHAATSGYEGEIFAAAEGMQIELSGDQSQTDASSDTQPFATRKLAVHEVRRDVLMAVRSPEIAATLRAAAAAEGLDIWEAADPDTAMEIARTSNPAIILLEDDGNDDVYEFARAIRQLDRASDGEIGVIAVGGTPVSHLDDAHHWINDRLLWPSSAGYIRTKMHAWLLRRACRWQNAPLPPDEAQRMRSLRALGILDTEPEARFDQYTELASRSFDVPIALVSLIDEERQWFKSRHGLDATETPRDMAVCAHAILDDVVLQIPDALDDPRFADNPLVNDDPRMRFYAGVPLTLSDGSRAGTLCVIDYRPRLLDDGQLAELERLGSLVADELERR
ncbi:MAG: MBL fold metallo-hydrolase [Acidimicrobiia bacterium]|nr:MBL fold metallo-hydrolase [Acidimicrobiia bacterium]